MSVTLASARQALSTVITEEIDAAAAGNDLVSIPEQRRLPSFIRAIAERVRADKPRNSRLYKGEVLGPAVSQAHEKLDRYAGNSAQDRRYLSLPEVRALSADDPDLGTLTFRAYQRVKSGGAPIAELTKVLALARGNPLFDVAMDTAEEWGERINNSDIFVDVGGLSPGAVTPEALRAFAARELSLRYDSEEQQPLDIATVTTAEIPPAEHMGAPTGRLADDGFAYAPRNRDARRILGQQIQAIIGKVGDEADLLGASAETLAYSPYVDGEVRVSSFIFANPHTREFVHLYVRQGSM